MSMATEAKCFRPFLLRLGPGWDNDAGPFPAPLGSHHEPAPSEPGKHNPHPGRDSRLGHPTASTLGQDVAVGRRRSCSIRSPPRYRCSLSVALMTPPTITGVMIAMRRRFAEADVFQTGVDDGAGIVGDGPPRSHKAQPLLQCAVFTTAPS